MSTMHLCLPLTGRLMVSKSTGGCNLHSPFLSCLITISTIALIFNVN
jgi:hypothetical protein